MASVSKSETYPIPMENFYRVITDYESYPQFMSGVDHTRIVEETSQGALVEYTLTIIKSFTYRLHLTHERPHRVSWVLDSGNMFKTNTGAWEFEDLGDGQTQVTYTVDTEFRLMVPKMIVKKLIGDTLNTLFENVRQRAQNL